MSNKGRMAALGVAAIATLAVASPAQAVTGAEQRKAERLGVSAVPSFKLDGSNGYEIRGGGFGSSVTLVALNKNLSASYAGSGVSSETEMAADYGEIGSLDLTFKPKGKKQKEDLPKRCEGRPGKVQKGTWKGSIKLDRSFTQVDASKAKGEVYYPGNFECSGGGGGGNDPVVLSASGDSGGRSVSFQAVEPKPKKAPFFVANTFEFHDDVMIQLSASVKGEKGDFRYDLGDESAKVKPPKPFSGRGELASGEWTGDLEVKVPGEKLNLIDGFTANVGVLHR